MSSFFYNASIVLLVLWIGVWAFLYFRKDARKLVKFNTKEAIVRNKTTLIIGVLLFAFPFVWVNFVVDDGIQNYKKIKSEYTELYSEGRNLAFYEYAIKAFPENEYVHIDFIQYFNKWRILSKLQRLGDSYTERLKTEPENDWQKELQSIGYSISGLDEFQDGEFLNASDTTTSLYHYAMGLESDRLGNYHLSEYHFLQALSDPNMREFAYERLEYLWYHNFTYDEVKARAYDWDVFVAMPFSLKKSFYIEDGAWDWYFYNSLYRDFLSADLLGYIAVLLAVVIWGLFVYKMLFINADKLKLIFSLFFLGSLLPILVYVFSDLLRALYIEWEIDLDHLDFWYNFINIGMVEELSKFLSWFIIYLLFKKRFKRPVHFMLLPIVSALGFAFTENLIYVNSEDYDIIFLRSAICIAGHMSSSAMIGYAYYRGRVQNDWRKTFLYVFAGFILASLTHGLYDYFLFTHKSLLAIIVFLIEFHLFILFINNVLNFTKIRDNQATNKLRDSGILLMIGLVLIFLSQYILIGIEYGNHAANDMLRGNIIFALLVLVYLVSMFRKIRIKPRVLNKFSFADVIGQFLTNKEASTSNAIQYQGEHFKLFAPKTNQFVGSQFPVIVKVEKSIEVQNDDNWVLVKFEKPITVGGCYEYKALMKCKMTDQELYMDKIEIILLFIPDVNAFEARADHHSADFNYVGKVYSRPMS